MKTDAFLLKWSYINLVAGVIIMMTMGLVGRRFEGFVGVLFILGTIIGAALVLVGLLYSIRKIAWKR
jgi:hypothetical protein